MTLMVEPTTTEDRCRFICETLSISESQLQQWLQIASWRTYEQYLDERILIPQKVLHRLTYLESLAEFLLDCKDFNELNIYQLFQLPIREFHDFTYCQILRSGVDPRIVHDVVLINRGLVPTYNIYNPSRPFG